MYYPTMAMMKAYEKKDYALIPLKKEMYSDLFTPIIMLKKLKSFSSHCFILESNEDAKNWGRYTFLGFSPKYEFTCKKGRMKFQGKYRECYDPSGYLRKLLGQYKSMDVPGMPPLTGGLIGYFAYDYRQYADPSLWLDAEDDEKFKDVDVMLFDEIVCLDHYQQKVSIIVNVDIHHIDEDYPRKCRRLDEIEAMLKMETMEVQDPLRIRSPFKPLYGKKAYSEMVEKGKQAIKGGDVSSLVLSNRIAAKCYGTLLDTYRILRVRHPSPYMFYFSSSSLEVAGASPETFVKLQDGIVTTFPIAGTRPRGKNDAEDAAYVEELRCDAQVLAEHEMQVALSRKDLSTICKPDSVGVIKNQDVLKHSKAMYIASEVRGEIREDRDALDAIETLLPAGTLSGVPKVRAYQLIHELEHQKRGLYGGAIGYLDFKGNMDTCIGLHLAYKKKDRVYVRSGASINGHSLPEKAYADSLKNAKTIFDVLQEAKGGID